MIGSFTGGTTTPLVVENWSKQSWLKIGICVTLITISPNLEAKFDYMPSKQFYSLWSQDSTYKSHFKHKWRGDGHVQDFRFLWLFYQGLGIVIPHVIPFWNHWGHGSIIGLFSRFIFNQSGVIHILCMIPQTIYGPWKSYASLMTSTYILSLKILCQSYYLNMHMVLKNLMLVLWPQYIYDPWKSYDPAHRAQRASQPLSRAI